MQFFYSTDTTPFYETIISSNTKITFVQLTAVLLLASIIDAAPKPAAKNRQQVNRQQVKRAPVLPKAHSKSANPVRTPNKVADKKKRQLPFFLPGNPVYPNYYPQPASPLVDFQSALQAAFLSGVHYADVEKYLKKENATDSNGKPLPLEARAGAAFEASFVDKSSNATDLQGKLIAFENLGNANVINPFLFANSFDGKAGKVGNVNSSVVALVNPYQSSHVDAVFGPEIAPRYEIHYSPTQGLTLDPVPFTGAGINSAAIGVAPIAPSAFGPAAFGPELGPYSAFGVAPSFNNLVNPYPYPYPFLPGFDAKAFKPHGNGTSPTEQ